jgi:hypothetical protein
MSHPLTLHLKDLKKSQNGITEIEFLSKNDPSPAIGGSPFVYFQ